MRGQVHDRPAEVRHPPRRRDPRFARRAAGRALLAYRYIKSRAFWTLIEATHKEAAAAEGVTVDIFDTPIVAAAKKAKVDALVTFDRKHLIRPSVADYIGAAITTPDQILKRIRAERH